MESCDLYMLTGKQWVSIHYAGRAGQGRPGQSRTGSRAGQGRAGWVGKDSVQDRAGWGRAGQGRSQGRAVQGKIQGRANRQIQLAFRLSLIKT